jgi:hypothetical protein
VALLENIIPTVENIAAACRRVLKKSFPKGMLCEVRGHETERDIASRRAG